MLTGVLGNHIFLFFGEVISDESTFRKLEESPKSSPGDDLLLEMSLSNENIYDEIKHPEDYTGDVMEPDSIVKIRRWHPRRRKKANLIERKAVMEDHKTRMGVRYRLKKKRTKASLEYTTITSRDRNDALNKESRNETSNYIRKSRGISSSPILEEEISSLSQSKNYRRIVPSRAERLAQARGNVLSRRRPLFGVANKVRPIITRNRKGRERTSNPSDEEEPNLSTKSGRKSVLDNGENAEFPSYDEMHDPAPPRGRYTPSPDRVSNLKSETENDNDFNFTTETVTKLPFQNKMSSLTPKPVPLTLNTQNEPTPIDIPLPHEMQTANERGLEQFVGNPKTNDQIVSPQHSMKFESSIDTPTSRSPSLDPDYDFYYDYEDANDNKVSTIPRPFSYGYKVNAKESGNFHSRSEKRNGKEVVGSYEVALPDGRIQVVTYIADDDGFRAEVTYKEKANIPIKPSVEEPHTASEDKTKAITATANKNEIITESPNFINSLAHNDQNSFSFRNIAFPQVTPLPLTHQGSLLSNHLNLDTFGAKENFPVSLDEENNVIPDPIGGLVTTIESPTNPLTDFEFKESENIPPAPVYPENSFDFQNHPLHPNDIFSGFVEPSPKPIPPPVNREVARIPPNPFIRNKPKSIHMPVKPRPRKVVNFEPPIHPLLKPGVFNRPVTVAPPNTRVQGRRPFSHIHPNSVIPNHQGPGTGIHFPNIQFTPFHRNNHFPNNNHLIQHFPNFPISTENPLLQQFPEIHRQVPTSKPKSFFNTRPIKGRLDFNKIHTFPTTSPNPFKLIIDGTRTSRIQPTQKPIHTTTTPQPLFNVHLTPTTTPHSDYVDQNFQVNQNLDYYDYPDYETFPFGGHIELLKTKTPSPVIPIQITTPSPPSSFPFYTTSTPPSRPLSPSPVFTTALPPPTFQFFKPVTGKSQFTFGDVPSTISPTGGTSFINPGLFHGSKNVFRPPRPHHFRAVIRAPKTDTIKNLFQNSAPKSQKPSFRSPKVKNLKDSFTPFTPKQFQPVHEEPSSRAVLSKEFPTRSHLSTPPRNSASSGLFTNRHFPTQNPTSHVPTPSPVNFFSNRPLPTTPSPVPYRLVLRKKNLNPISRSVTPHIPTVSKPVLFHYPFPNGTPSPPLLYNPNQKVVLQALGKTHSIPLLLPISGSASEKLEVVDKGKRGLSVLPNKNATLKDRELLFSKSDIYPRHLPRSKGNKT